MQSKHTHAHTQARTTLKGTTGGDKTELMVAPEIAPQGSSPRPVRPYDSLEHIPASSSFARLLSLTTSSFSLSPISSPFRVVTHKHTA